MSSPDTTGRDPEGTADSRAFRLLADETRFAVLHALWEASDPESPSPMRFSDLRERVDVDDPGRLNYHLNELTTHFVRRTEEGYELRDAGERIVRVLRAGTAIRDPEIDPVAVEMACWYCGAETEWSYRDGWRYLECTRCDARCVESFPPGVISKTEFPPSGLVDRTPNEMNRADRIWVAHRRASVMDGVCPECAGSMPVRSVQVCEDHHPDWESVRFCDACGSIFRILVSHVCDVCKYHWRMPALFYPSRHPAVIAFYHDHGVEFDLARYEQRALLLDYREEVLTEDPFRLRITVPLDGESLQLTFDDRMAVVEPSP